ncbi:MAG: hypothetical protein IBJ18_02905 [Phycisphaerales bacterium]|nr:hypothetical protein [Phycisphaerales bacterium]
MARTHVIIEISARRVGVLVMAGASCIARRSADLPQNAAGDAASIIAEAGPHLKKFVNELNIKNAEATVAINLPGAAAGVFSVAYEAGATAAETAALLALSDFCTYPVGENPSAVCPMAIDASNATPRQRHVLATCESAVQLQRISELCTSAGLRVTRLIPGEALTLWLCVRSLMSEDEGVARGVLWIGEHSSILAARAGGVLKFVRTLSLGTENFIDAMCRPLRVRSAGSSQPEEFALSSTQARAILAQLGIPSPGTIIDDARGIDASALLPAIQPALQRLAIEIKQSLRFGLTEEQRAALVLHIDGPGSMIARLGELIGRQAGVIAQTGVSFGLLAPATDAEPATITAYNALIGCSIALESREQSQRRTLRRVSAALWAGTACSMALIAFGALSARSAQHDELAILSTLSAGRSAAGQPSAMSTEVATKIVGKAQTIRATNARIAEALGQRCDFGATLRTIAQATPPGFTITRIDLSGDDQGAVALITGQAQAGDDQRFAESLKGFTDALTRSPAITGVKLGNTGRLTASNRDAHGDNRGEPSHRFDLTLALVALPADLSSLDPTATPTAQAQTPPKGATPHATAETPR